MWCAECAEQDTRQAPGADTGPSEGDAARGSRHSLVVGRPVRAYVPPRLGRHLLQVCCSQASLHLARQDYETAAQLCIHAVQQLIA